MTHEHATHVQFIRYIYRRVIQVIRYIPDVRWLIRIVWVMYDWLISDDFLSRRILVCTAFSNLPSITATNLRPPITSWPSSIVLNMYKPAVISSMSGMCIQSCKHFYPVYTDQPQIALHGLVLQTHLWLQANHNWLIIPSDCLLFSLSSVLYSPNTWPTLVGVWSPYRTDINEPLIAETDTETKRKYHNCV